MFLKLSNENFIKVKPDKNLFSFFYENKRIVVEINQSAKKILSLCDGTHTKEEIIDLLKEENNEPVDKVKNFVEDFTRPFIYMGVILECKEKIAAPVVRGSEKIFFPDYLLWEITNVCPLKCKHCYLGEKKNITVNEEEIKKVLNFIDEKGISIVQITGGEALTCESFNYILNELVNRQLGVSVSTSGVLFNNDILNTLAKLKLVNGFVKVSIDGKKDTHNNIRGTDLAFDKTISFIKEMVNEKITVQVATCVLNQPKEELEDLTIMMKELGVSLYSIGKVVLKGEAQSNNLDSVYTHSNLKNFLNYLNDKYADDNFSLQPYKEIDLPNCGSGYNMIRIKPNLDVTPCPMIDFNMGNLTNESIDDIMNKYGAIFHELKTPCRQICDGCKYSEECGQCTAKGFIYKDSVSNCKWYETQQNIVNELL